MSSSSGMPTSVSAGDLQLVAEAERTTAAIPPRPLMPYSSSSSSSALVEYTAPAAKPEDEDLEIKLRRIIDCVPVRVSNTSGSSAGSGSGDFHQGGKLFQAFKMNSEDINRCQIQEWYPKFKSISIKTLIHELPESFIQYLLDDSGPFLLPLSITNDDALPNRVHNPEEEEDFVVSEGSGDEADEPTPPPSFPELEMEIKASIESLGGAIFPKLNWSAPKDSSWISTTGNLKCTSFPEIALLLRSSDSVVHDLCHAYDSCSDKTASRPSSFVLALRKWYPSLKPDMEFRCFVNHKRLLGICQREVTNFYPALLERRGGLQELIEELFVEKVMEDFGSESYTFDVYVTRDGRVKLLDFNPWGGPTLPLLFSWDELEEKVKEEDNELEFRVVESRCGIRPGLKTAVPYDYLDTSPGSGWDQFLRNAGDELRRQTETGAGA